MNRHFQALMPIKDFPEWRKNHPVRMFANRLGNLADMQRYDNPSSKYMADKMEVLSIRLYTFGVPGKDEKDLEYKTVRQIAVAALIVGFLIGIIGVALVL